MQASCFSSELMQAREHWATSIGIAFTAGLLLMQGAEYLLQIVNEAIPHVLLKDIIMHTSC
ncbi:hypothetical protein SLEP1_g19320 [Rubroshorea leprosula]|nr:hypothetical protein SLEP1_g19320 [Rubroshorea leprosula]